MAHYITKQLSLSFAFALQMVLCDNSWGDKHEEAFNRARP